MQTNCFDIKDYINFVRLQEGGSFKRIVLSSSRETILAWRMYVFSFTNSLIPVHFSITWHLINLQVRPLFPSLCVNFHTIYFLLPISGQFYSPYLPLPFYTILLHTILYLSSMPSCDFLTFLSSPKPFSHSILHPLNLLTLSSSPFPLLPFTVPLLHPSCLVHLSCQFLFFHFLSSLII